MKINQKFIPASNTFTRPGIKMDPEYITIHETDNTAKGANDEAHARLQYNGNSRQASWHFQVDEDSIYQSLPTNEVGWHAGDGRGPGNMKSIGIEICVNSDGNFKKAVENAVWLTQYLMDQHNIPVSKVVQHNHWSGKNCPRYLRSGDKGVTWKDFINKVNGKKETSKPVNKPAASTKEEKYSVVTKLNGYINAADAKARKNKKSEIKAGSYYIFNKANGMINVSTKKGVPGSWINPNDNKKESNKTHTVVKNETLWGLSKKYGVSVAQLKTLNKLKSDLIKPGQKLRVK